MKNHQNQEKAKNTATTIAYSASNAIPFVAHLLLFSRFLMISHLLFAFSSSLLLFFFIISYIFVGFLIRRLISWPFSSLLLLPSNGFTSRFTCVSVETIQIDLKHSILECLPVCACVMAILYPCKNDWSSSSASIIRSKSSFILYNMVVVDDETRWMFIAICTVHRMRHISKTSTTFDLYTQFPCLRERSRMRISENGINRQT